ncbi:hypothetical protein Tco_1342076 [Tanacetum coccineum]
MSTMNECVYNQQSQSAPAIHQASVIHPQSFQAPTVPLQSSAVLPQFDSEGKVDMGKALDLSLVVTNNSGTKLENHDTSSRYGNDTNAEDANNKPVYNKEPIAELHLTAEHNVLVNGQQHAEHPEFNYDGRADQDAKKCQVKSPLLDTSPDNKTTEFSNQSLESENISLTCRECKEKVFANATLKNELIKLKENNMDTNFEKPSILGKPVLQPLRNQLVVRQLNAFQSERPKFSKSLFASQVDVKNDLPKSVTPHYLLKVRESVFVKPHHVIASGSSRNSSRELYGSNNMAHNYYLEEANKNTQDKNINLKPREMPSAKTHDTPNACTPKLRSNNQMSRNWPASKISDVTLKAMQKADHSRNLSSFLDTKHFTGRIFNTVSLRWIPTGKIFTSSPTKVNNKPLHGSNEDITNPYECEQTLNVSACTLNLSVGYALHEMTHGTISSGLMQNPPPSTPYVPLTKNDWDLLFKPMFDEYFNPPSSVVSLVRVAAALRPANPTGSPSSTSIDQAAPSTSTSSTIHETYSLVNSDGVEEPLQPAQLVDDPFIDILTSEPSSQESSSIVQPTHLLTTSKMDEESSFRKYDL